jgi:hypothetical protein
MNGIDGGIILMLFGAFMLCVAPASRTISARKAEASFAIDAPVGIVFPPATFDDLVEAIDAALENDDLNRGTRAVSEIYDHARDRD